MPLCNSGKCTSNVRGLINFLLDITRRSYTMSECVHDTIHDNVHECVCSQAGGFIYVHVHVSCV